jgi:hypothetical protein
MRYENWSGNAQGCAELAPWERFRAERTIEAEDGICEVVAGKVSRAISLPWSLAASRHLAGRRVKAREGVGEGFNRSKRLKLADGEGVKAET